MKKIIGFLSCAVILTAISCNNSAEKENQTKQTKDVKVETRDVKTNNDVEVTVPVPPPPPSPKTVIKKLPLPPLPPPPPLPPLPKKHKG
jgi:hypothetical protein